MKTPADPFVIVDASTPIYRQIYDAVRRSILEGRIAPGTRLPASRQLAAQLSVSRMTVVNAYDQLFAEGYLEGKRGSGTFVASELPEEFLRIERKDTAVPNGKTAIRKLVLSAYGEKTRRDMETVASNHSPTVSTPFQHSLIAADEFPFELWSKITLHHLKYSYRQLSGYGDAAGYLPLRKAIAHHLRSTRGVNCEERQVIVTNGTQQAVFLITQLLLSRADPVWLEDPCHLGTSDVMSAFGIDVRSVPVDDEGFDIERARKMRKPAKMIYLTPSRQFPLGMTMSLQRRLSVLEWAKENDAWIIEDDYDSEFRYSGRPLPALQGLDRGGRVLYVGTFSKTLFPGLRLGCVVLPPDLVRVFSAARTLNDMHAPMLEQLALADFIGEGHFERHVRRMRTLYRTRQAVLVGEVEKNLGRFIEIAPSDAGMHLIGWLPKGVDDREVSRAVTEAGLRAGAVSRYAKRRLERGGLMLGYTAFNEREIVDGVKRLRQVFEKLSRPKLGGQRSA